MTRAGLHHGLRAPLQLCEATRKDLLAILTSLPRRQWNARRSADSWSVAEHVDHLIRAEAGTSKMARRLIRGDFEGLSRPADVRLYDSRLARYPYGRFPAPEGLVPAARPLKEALAQLDSVHRRFVDELRRFDGSDPDAIASEDQDTGLWFTLAGWVRLQALHEEHHLHRIQALLAIG